MFAPDRIGIVGFHTQAFVIARPAEAHQPWLLERCQQLHTRLGSTTNMTDGLRKGIEMANRTPPGVRRRLWLLSDGQPNEEMGLLWPMVEKAHQSRLNINTIGFGDSYNRDLLERIAKATHNGKFVPVQSLRELTSALVGHDIGTSRGKSHHRSETTVVIIDLSGSMGSPMEGKTKVQVVEEALTHLILYKQRVWS